MAFSGVLGTATVAGCLASAFGGVLGPGTPDLAPAALVASAPAFALAYVSLRNLSDSPGLAFGGPAFGLRALKDTTVPS